MLAAFKIDCFNKSNERQKAREYKTLSLSKRGISQKDFSKEEKVVAKILRHLLGEKKD